MKSANFQWQLPKQQEMPETFIQFLQKKGIPSPLAALFWQRNLRTPEVLEQFLNPSLDGLHDPFLFFDMEKAVERIQQAIVAGEQILIYGDYDADGITSTTIMKETLELLGAEVDFYLPNRFKDGYGPNLAVYQQKITEGAQLILTVDNGVSGHEAISFANEQGVDVIVTDHHEMPEELPPAYAIIHPRHPKGDYPFGDLAGVGVAFKVACALLEEVPQEFLDLVAIGTIADMVSLTDENRILVSFGLQAIENTGRVGLKKLMEVSNVTNKDIDETTIGFAIGPRLNAIGRLADPNPAVDLLTTFDQTVAQQGAERLDQINTERKKLVETITEQALSVVQPADKINVITGENWHEGILGIVAGRVLKATGKPTLVLTIKEDGLAKGSGRSVEAVNLFEMLDGMREWMTSFGGHHAAVGLSLRSENIVPLKAQMNQYMIDHQLEGGINLRIDAILPLAAVSSPFVDSLKVLAPFGMDNPVPNFLFEGVTVVDSRQIGTNKQHIKFTLIDDTQQKLAGIGFGFGSEALEFQDSEMSVVGQLSMNEWNGNRKPQLLLEDYQISELQLFDYRPKRHQQSLPTGSDTLFICFSDISATQWSSKTQSKVIVFKNMTLLQQEIKADEYQEIVFVDCPVERETIKQILRYLKVSRLSMMFQAEDDAYLDGLGSREQYAKLFKFVATQEQVDVRYKLSVVAEYLKIPKKLLIFMIQVFSELEFVKIDNGVMRRVDTPVSRPLNESQIYQERIKKIETEAFLLLSDVHTLKQWFSE